MKAETFDHIVKTIQATHYFNLHKESDIDFTFDYKYSPPKKLLKVQCYPNCLLATPLTASAELEMLRNPYNHILKLKNKIYCLYRFPSPIATKEGKRLTASERSQMPEKYETRLNNLIYAQDINQSISLSNTLLIDDDTRINEIKYIGKTNHNRGEDDKESDRTCATLAQAPKPYREIKRINTSGNTLIILNNAKEAGTHALDRYLNNVNDLYNDIISNYIFEHSELLRPENFKYENTKFVAHVTYKELSKLFPHTAFKFTPPSGVTVTYNEAPRRHATTPKKRSKNDIVIFTFTNEYVDTFRSIIKREESNENQPKSFIKFPIYFLLEALKSENLGKSGLPFLLWLLTLYRMPNPKLFHTIEAILQDIKADTTHGTKKPLATLSKYFQTLQKYNIIRDIYQPIKFNRLDLPRILKHNNHYIRLHRPTKTLKDYNIQD